jgi:hypothetical protein
MRLNEKMVVCNDCKEEYPINYMIHKDIWLSILNSSEDTRDVHLCILCLEKRINEKLGRDLSINDFTGAPVNQLLFLGHKLSKISQK